MVSIDISHIHGGYVEIEKKKKKKKNEKKKKKTSASVSKFGG